MTIAAIHQPTYLPWLGFFHKIRSCDVFIILDDVQFPRQGGNWMNRCRINAGGIGRWMTVPVSRPSGLQLVGEVRAADPLWVESHARIVDLNYRDAPLYGDVKELLKRVFGGPGEILLDFNIATLMELLDFLDPKERDKIVRSSTLGVGSTGTMRLVDLTREVGASVYLSGDGSDGYLDPAVFEREGVSLEYQGFIEPFRPQLRTAEFIPGLSIVDALMMVGAPGVNSLLDSIAQSGR